MIGKTTLPTSLAIKLCFRSFQAGRQFHGRQPVEILAGIETKEPMETLAGINRLAGVSFSSRVKTEQSMTRWAVDAHDHLIGEIEDESPRSHEQLIYECHEIAFHPRPGDLNQLLGHQPALFLSFPKFGIDLEVPKFTLDRVRAMGRLTGGNLGLEFFLLMSGEGKYSKSISEVTRLNDLSFPEGVVYFQSFLLTLFSHEPEHPNLSAITAAFWQIPGVVEALRY